MGLQIAHIARSLRYGIGGQWFLGWHASAAKRASRGGLSPQWRFQPHPLDKAAETVYKSDTWPKGRVFRGPTSQAQNQTTGPSLPAGAVGPGHRGLCVPARRRWPVGREPQAHPHRCRRLDAHSDGAPHMDAYPCTVADCAAYCDANRDTDRAAYSFPHANADIDAHPCAHSCGHSHAAHPDPAAHQ